MNAPFFAPLRSQRSKDIAVYDVVDDEIILMDLLEDENYLWSPNDLSVLPDGTIYATNDYRGDLDLYLKRKSSQIAHFNPATRKWNLAAEGLGLANGIWAPVMPWMAE